MSASKPSMSLIVLILGPRLVKTGSRRDIVYMYLAVTDHAVNAVLLRLDQEIQKPIFYISKALVEAKTHYLPLEKAVLAIIHVVRKLPHYFQSHIVVVLIEHPLQALLRKSDFTRRIAKWGAFLGAFDI